MTFTWLSSVVRRLALVSVGVCVLFGPLSGCLLDGVAPEVGEQLVDDCSNEDSDPGTPVDFQRDIVERIFMRDSTGCLQCHAPNAPSPIGFQIGQLDLSSYDELRAGGLIGRSQIVVPEFPCDSILLQKVTASPPFNARMPQNGPPYLADEEIQLIHDWIAEGARSN
ncbi:MAG: hypothetical protein Tsb0020_42000 [Haliangiales bacterium]